MSAGSSSTPSFRDAEAKTTSAQPAEDELSSVLHKRTTDHASLKENGSTNGVQQKVVSESFVEVDADLEAEDDPEISQIPAEVRRGVGLRDDSMHTVLV